MIDEPQPVTVVGVGSGVDDLRSTLTAPNLDDPSSPDTDDPSPPGVKPDTTAPRPDEFTVLAVDSPAALSAMLEERRVGCVVLAPDGTEWDPVAALDSLASRDAEVPVVLVTAGDIDAYVDAGVFGAVADVVRPGDDATLARRVRETVARYRDRVRDSRVRERYEALVDHSPAPVGIVDADRTIRFANDALADLLAAEAPADLVGRDVAAFVASDSREVAMRRLRRVIEAGEPAPAAQRTLVATTDEEKYVLAALTPVEFGGESAAQLIANDVTEHKRLESELRAQRDRFSTLFESLNEPVVDTRFDGEAPVVTGVNAAFAETFGVDPETVVGDSLDDIIVPADEREDAAAFNRRARAGEHLEREVSRRTPDGPRDFLLRFVPYRSGGERGGYAIYIDITDRREWERQLRRQNERLEEVSAVVSHDLRNPLNVARGTTEILAERADESDRELFARVQNAHDRMETIIAEMLTLARQGQSVSDLESVDLASAAREAWATTETADATLSVETDATILADGSRLQGAFENLYRNAVEHAGPDVTVTVGAMPACPDEEGTALARRGGFYVADDGPGIPADDRDSVFQSGYTTAEDGTGFGLAIVQSIVEAHSWDIAVTESAGGGARFEVTGVEYAD